MVLRKIFGTPSETEKEAYIEVNVMDSERKTGRLGIRVEKLNDFSDTDRVLKALRAGNIVFLKIKGLRDKDLGELKRAVEKLKKTVIANNGDMAGVEEEWLILTPEYVAIERE